MIVVADAGRTMRFGATGGTGLCHCDRKPMPKRDIGVL